MTVTVLSNSRTSNSTCRSEPINRTKLNSTSDSVNGTDGKDISSVPPSINGSTHSASPKVIAGKTSKDLRNLLFQQGHIHGKTTRIIKDTQNVKVNSANATVITDNSSLTPQTLSTKVNILSPMNESFSSDESVCSQDIEANFLRDNSKEALNASDISTQTPNFNSNSVDTSNVSFGERLNGMSCDPVPIGLLDEDLNGHTEELESINLQNNCEKSNKCEAPISASHLTNLLTTALLSEDKNLLRTCLSTRDTPTSLSTIRLTIERLHSPLVIPLLGYIADTMYRRPGRAGCLMVWVQWILVNHGGYISSLLASKEATALSPVRVRVAAMGNDEGARTRIHTIPHPSRSTVLKLLQRLKALERVCGERVRGLERLLTLKGKLDLLVAQIEVRKGRIKELKRKREEEYQQRTWIEGKHGCITLLGSDTVQCEGRGIGVKALERDVDGIVDVEAAAQDMELRKKEYNLRDEAYEKYSKSVKYEVINTPRTTGRSQFSEGREENSMLRQHVGSQSQSPGHIPNSGSEEDQDEGESDSQAFGSMTSEKSSFLDFDSNESFSMSDDGDDNESDTYASDHDSINNHPPAHARSLGSGSGSGSDSDE